MKHYSVIALCAFLTCCCQQKQDKARKEQPLQQYQIVKSDEEEVLQLIAQQSPNTVWNATTLLKADINSDGNMDYAIWGLQDSLSALVAVVVSPIGTKSQAEIAQFKVDRSCQDCICALPAEMEIESMDYDPSETIGTALPGFERSSEAKGLVLSDGMCDSIHFFWDHQANKLSWWRL